MDWVKPVLLLNKLESQDTERVNPETVGETGFGSSCELKITVVLGGRMLWYFSQPGKIKESNYILNSQLTD